jgi:hypothetical protein
MHSQTRFAQSEELAQVAAHIVPFPVDVVAEVPWVCVAPPPLEPLLPPELPPQPYPTNTRPPSAIVIAIRIMSFSSTRTYGASRKTRP